MLYQPGHRLFQVAFKAEWKQAPIIRLIDGLAKFQLKILHSWMVEEAKGANWSVFLDSEDYGITAEGVRKIFQAFPFIRDLRVAGGGEFIVDQLYHPVVDPAGQRLVFLGKESFQRMISSLNEIYGAGGDVIAYQQGYATGSKDAGAFRSFVKGGLREFLGEAVKLYLANGFGTCTILEADFDRMHFGLQMTDSVECSGRKSDRPLSQWIRGHICGGISTSLQTPMACTETKCVAAGDDYCQFELEKSAG